VQCHASSVEFFESIPVPALPDDDESEVDFEPHEPEWLGPPSQLFGASVAVGGVVHRSEHLFVGIRGATAYPTGVSFHVEVAIRQGDWPRAKWEETEELLWGNPIRRARTDQGELLVGVELADGRRTSAAVRWGRGMRRDQPPTAPILVDHGGRGSGGYRTKLSEHGTPAARAEAWFVPLSDRWVTLLPSLPAPFRGDGMVRPTPTAPPKRTSQV
jgi:hypothetical protein